MEPGLLNEIIVVFDWLLFSLFSLAVLYLLVYAIASLFYKTPIFKTPEIYTRFLVLIPAYKEDNVVINAVNTIVNQSYPKELYEVVVISDRMAQSTNDNLTSIGGRVLIYHPYESLKAKALNFAISQYDEGSFDGVVILDADNMVEPDFLFQLNKAFAAGLKAIQTHRTAKKMQTDIAFLDGISEEINNAIFRKGHVVLGVSSALIGSGMAFPFDWFKKTVIYLATAGEDKELEMLLLRDKLHVSYLDDVMVLDDKTAGKSTYYNQRRRWLAAQFYALGKALRWLPKAVQTCNIDYIDKVIQWMMPPRVVLLGLSFCLAFLVSFISFTVALKWWFIFLLCLLALGIAIPLSLMKGITFSSLLKLPSLFILMVLNFFRTKGAVKSFIHTKKE